MIGKIFYQNNLFSMNRFQILKILKLNLKILKSKIKF